MVNKLQNTILITCAKFTGNIIAREVESHGFKVAGINTYNIETRGSIQDTYKLNYVLRTAHRVLFRIGQFKASNVRQLTRNVKNIDWEKYIPVNGYFTIASSVNHPQIRDTRYANLVVKDAIADRFNEKYGSRPDSGSSKDKCSVFYHWDEGNCEVFLDTTGNSLSRHGYRMNPWKAPMMESLAVAVIQETRWDGVSHFINPMCGSGTLAIEAALIGSGIFPGQYRSNYSFMHLRNFDDVAWHKIKSYYESKIPDNLTFKIIATDISRRAIEASRLNAEEAGIEHLITFKPCSFTETEIPDGKGIVIMNPEYGERMGEVENLTDTYREVGDFFKNRCSGYTGYIFTGNQKLAKNVGLRTSRKIPFMNGNIECRLLEYELYAGSKKIKKDTEDPE
ncbi:class I SAM-dependent RNA methyltransferase [Bacteroidota bacterium]